MLFQRPNPFPMSIRDNVVAGVKAHRIAKGKQLDVVAETRLREVGLWDAVKDRLNDAPLAFADGVLTQICRTGEFSMPATGEVAPLGSPTYYQRIITFRYLVTRQVVHPT